MPVSPQGSRETVEARLLQLLTEIAPDIDPSTVRRDRALREQFDFDSMDLLHFATAVSAAFSIDIAETEYAELSNLARAADFVLTRMAPADPVDRAHGGGS